MPREGPSSGMRCTRTDRVCLGRMRPVDVVHPEKVEVIDGKTVVTEESKIIRLRRCPICWWREKTAELPIGEGYQGPAGTISEVGPIDGSKPPRFAGLFDISEYR